MLIIKKSFIFGYIQFVTVLNMGNKGYCEQILGRESADITKQCIKVLEFSLFKMFI